MAQKPGPKVGKPQTKKANIEPKKAPDRYKLHGDLAEYIEKTEIPIFKEWCVMHHLLPQTVMAWPEFKDLHDECIAKKEAALERASLQGSVNTTQAIFSLKQLGWSDKQQVEHVTPQTINVRFEDTDGDEEDELPEC